MSIASIIKRIRKEKNLTQDYIAAKLCLTIPAYSKLEDGTTYMSVPRLIQMEEILGKSATSMMNLWRFGVDSEADMKLLKELEAEREANRIKDIEIHDLQKQVIDYMEEASKNANKHFD